MGFPESSDFGQEGFPPNTTLRSMANLGFIKSPSASILLGDKGSVLFGGIDTSAYSGELTVLPVVRDPETKEYDRLAVNLNSVTANTPRGAVASAGEEFPVRAMLDTGNFDNKLPPSYVRKVWNALGVRGLNLTGPAAVISFGLCNCNLAESSATFDFELGSFHISLPVKSFVIDVPASILQEFNAPALPEGTCVFAINPQYDTTNIPYILGGTFLDAVYFVTNEDHHEVGLAARNPNPGIPHILEIAAGQSLRMLGNASTSSTQPGSNGTASASGADTISKASAAVFAISLSLGLSLFL
jgi:hypothetical protein